MPRYIEGCQECHIGGVGTLRESAQEGTAWRGGRKRNSRLGGGVLTRLEEAQESKSGTVRRFTTGITNLTHRSNSPVSFAIFSRAMGVFPVTFTLASTQTPGKGQIRSLWTAVGGSSSIPSGRLNYQHRNSGRASG